MATTFCIWNCNNNKVTQLQQDVMKTLDNLLPLEKLSLKSTSVSPDRDRSRLLLNKK